MRQEVKKKLDLSILFADLENKAAVKPKTKKNMPRALRVGDICPGCGQEHLDYDGLLNLSCTRCGFTVAGVCT